MSFETYIITYDPQTENYRVDARREGETLEQALQRVGGWLQPNAVPTRIGLNFGDALCALKAGGRVAREGWNGKGMWLKLVPTDLAGKISFEHEALDALPWIGMKTADEKFVPWLASQTDMLATDWRTVW